MNGNMVMIHGFDMLLPKTIHSNLRINVIILPQLCMYKRVYILLFLYYIDDVLQLGEVS